MHIPEPFINLTARIEEGVYIEVIHHIIDLTFVPSTDFSEENEEIGLMKFNLTQFG